MTTLTEDEKLITYSDIMGMDNTPLYWVRFYKNHPTLEEAHKHGDKIIQALQENPKLKEGYDLWKKYVVDQNLFVSDLKNISKLKKELEESLIENNELSNKLQENYIIEDETIKLKAENEELKKKPLPQTGTWISEYPKRFEKLQQENESLRQLKKRVEEFFKNPHIGLTIDTKTGVYGIPLYQNEKSKQESIGYVPIHPNEKGQYSTDDYESIISFELHIPKELQQLLKGDSKNG